MQAETVYIVGRRDPDIDSSDVEFFWKYLA